MTSATPHRPGLQLDRSRSIPRQYDQPLRLLLIRDRTGDLPWVVQTILQVMAPIELVQTRGLANALWRLGRERFDSVLLDLSTRERFAVEACRHHIADVAAIPVLDLNSDDDVGTLYPPAVKRPRERAPDPVDRRGRASRGRRPGRHARRAPPQGPSRMSRRASGRPRRASAVRPGRGRPIWAAVCSAASSAATEPRPLPHRLRDSARRRSGTSTPNARFDKGSGRRDNPGEGSRGSSDVFSLLGEGR